MRMRATHLINCHTAPEDEEDDNLAYDYPCDDSKDHAAAGT
jgi:hypothetical protein